ncbi:hypothetical protein NDU88_006650 [Pleurodeles waltl]|uniref:Uncharacterized protein n=1 Tax=Pleurodeles waltl TaxID=8319 RepID=A0AAV7NV16_PLEWA|nr:hypothetical protein NDU88_006650 [Pleurodeles waltl]
MSWPHGAAQQPVAPGAAHRGIEVLRGARAVAEARGAVRLELGTERCPESGALGGWSGRLSVSAWRQRRTPGEWRRRQRVRPACPGSLVGEPGAAQRNGALCSAVRPARGELPRTGRGTLGVDGPGESLSGANARGTGWSAAERGIIVLLA